MIEKVDYKALWEQMCQRCDELDKKLAQRKWVGLEDWEIKKLAGTDVYSHLVASVAIAVEKALKERNNG
jgi:hypothetical protein